MSCKELGTSSCSSGGCIVLVLVVVLVLDTAYFSQRFRTRDGLNLRGDSSVCGISPANLAIRGRGRRRVPMTDEQEIALPGFRRYRHLRALLERAAS